MRAEHGPAGGPCCPRLAPPRPRASSGRLSSGLSARRPLQPRPSCRTWLVQGLVRFCPLRPRPLAEAGEGRREAARCPGSGPEGCGPPAGPPRPHSRSDRRGPASRLRTPGGLARRRPTREPHRATRRSRGFGTVGGSVSWRRAGCSGAALSALRSAATAGASLPRPSVPSVPREPHGDACGAAVRAGPLLCGRDPLGRRLSGLLKEKHQFLKREKK